MRARLLSVLCLLAFTASAGFYPRSQHFTVSWPSVSGANGYEVLTWKSGGQTNVLEAGKNTALDFTITRTNSTTYFVQVRAWVAEAGWLAAGGGWLDYPVCQWPPPPPVLDYLLLTGPVGVLVSGCSLTGNTNDYTGPVGYMTAEGLKVSPQADVQFFTVSPSVTATVFQGPTQPLAITPVYRN